MGYYINRTRKEILSDIKFYNEWTKEITRRANEAKQELKEYDELFIKYLSIGIELRGTK